MYLYIESLDREQTVFQLFKKDKIIKEKIEPVMTEDLLGALVSFLGAGKFSNIEAIFLHCGPGSFSAVRSGVLLGNTLAATLGIPLVSLKGEVDRHTLYKNFVPLLKRSKSKNIAAPIYNREPNITVSNKRQVTSDK